MSQLLVLASSVEADAENRVHACNILRALYRDTRLGDSVAAFVEGGLRVAIQGFEAADWAERNAATLLFSALVTRIFGVKREKDALSSKNCLTGKVFFQRYPSLHGFLLEKLKESTPETGALLPPTASAGTLQLYPALYPILLILSRIFPSPSDAVNNPFQLAAFVGPVAVCAANPVLAIRELAAKALVPLLPTADLGRHATETMNKITEPTTALPYNLQHGLLLQLNQVLLLTMADKDKHVQTDLRAVLAGAIVTGEAVERLVRSCTCPLVTAQYLTILNRLEEGSGGGGGGGAEGSCLEILEQCLVDKVFSEEESRSVDVWQPLFLKVNFIT